MRECLRQRRQPRHRRGPQRDARVFLKKTGKVPAFLPFFAAHTGREPQIVLSLASTGPVSWITSQLFLASFVVRLAPRRFPLRSRTRPLFPLDCKKKSLRNSLRTAGFRPLAGKERRASVFGRGPSWRQESSIGRLPTSRFPRLSHVACVSLASCFVDAIHASAVDFSLISCSFSPASCCSS